MKNYLERIEATAEEWNNGLFKGTGSNGNDLELDPLEVSPKPVNTADYCSFSVSYPNDDWIEAIHIEDQAGDILLDFNDPSPAVGGYQDNTETIILTRPGDVLTISVTVNAGSSYWTQSLSWGHDINSDDLVKIADLNSASGCPWTHIYHFTVPDQPGNYLASWWECYYNYTDPCGSISYGERRDFTLYIGDGVTEYPAEGYRISPQLALSGIQSVVSSLVSWDSTTTEEVTDVIIETSLDGGQTWSPAANNGPVPGINPGLDLDDLTLDIRQVLTTTDPAQTPELHSLSVLITGVIDIQTDLPRAAGISRLSEIELTFPNTILPGLARAYGTAQPVMITGNLNLGVLQGTVTKRGVPVANAKVIIINSYQEVIQEVVYTDTDGNYSVIVPGNEIYHLLVEYRDDDGLWQALSKPFISPEIEGI